MEYERLDYRTSDGSLDIDFCFVNGGSEGWLAYIISNINYRGRDTSYHATHRNHLDGDTYKSICWNTRVGSLKEMKAIAALWADVTALYIKNGGSFDSIAQKLLAKK